MDQLFRITQEETDRLKKEEVIRKEHLLNFDVMKLMIHYSGMEQGLSYLYRSF